jgi:hypothetical protein
MRAAPAPGPGRRRTVLRLEDVSLEPAYPPRGDAHGARGAGELVRVPVGALRVALCLGCPGKDVAVLLERVVQAAAAGGRGSLQDALRGVDRERGRTRGLESPSLGASRSFAAGCGFRNTQHGPLEPPLDPGDARLARAGATGRGVRVLREDGRDEPRLRVGPGPAPQGEASWRGCPWTSPRSSRRRLRSRIQIGSSGPIWLLGMGARGSLTTIVVARGLAGVPEPGWATS